MTQPSTQEKKTVIVVGGGVGGLSAAHELVKKGFHVIVYDRRKEEQLGGKARSLKLEGDEAPPYGEHGFRFFPAFYRHLVDTMSEIPYGDGGNVAENLVSADAVLFTSYEVPPFSLPLNLPWKSFQEVVDSTKFLASFLNLGLKGRDFAHYLCRMGEMLTSCDGRRAEFEQMSWWQFLLGQAPPARNVAYKDFSPFERYIAIGMTRNLVAAKAEEANALTVGRVGMQLLLSVFWPWRLWCRIVGDGFTPPGDVDRLLNGPTNEVWINPWIKHLKQQQVEFRTNVNLERIVFDPATRRVTGLEFAPAPKIHNRVYQVAQAKAVAAGLGPLTVMDLKTKHADLIKQAELEVLQEAKVPNAPAEVKDAIAAPTNADYYVFALPVEQMAKFAPTPMVEADERLQCVMALQDHVEWMTGLQYFLREPLGLTRGHHDHLDSEWALTSVEQTMFWSDDQNGPFDHGIKSVLSVDISEWGKVGTSIAKVASNCTPGEIADEVWVQLKKSLNKGGEKLRDDMKISWFLDDDIDQRRDPCKERALPPSVRERTKSASAEPTLLVNYEPLLVNKMGTAHLRPSAGPPASGGIRNMFLASDYVSTFTDLATMEGANEAARRAVNALLDEAKSSEQRCTVVPLREPLQFLRVFDGLMFKIAPRFPWRLGFELAVHALLRPAVCIFAAFNWVVRRF